MLERWTEISYYQFPSFDSSFKRDAYESWRNYLDGDTIYIIKEYDMGEDECLD